LFRPTTFSVRASGTRRKPRSGVHHSSFGGLGKITVLEEIRALLGISHDQIIYMGDGSSDLPVMMHVNHHDGLTSPFRKQCT